MSSWQPINTAPKDGRNLLLFFPCFQYPIMICWWGEFTEDPDDSGAWYEQYYPDGIGHGDGPISEQCDPTHWMELPEKP